MRHVSKTHRVALDWLFHRINLNTKIQIKYIDTKNQLADTLTKGNFTRGMDGRTRRKNHCQNTRDRSTTLVRTVPSLMKQERPCTPDFGQGTSAPRSLRVWVGLHRIFSLCHTRASALNDTRRQYGVPPTVIRQQTDWATGVAAGVDFISIAPPRGASARNCLRHLYLATCGREGNSSTPQPQSRDKDAFLRLRFASLIVHTADTSRACARQASLTGEPGIINGTGVHVGEVLMLRIRARSRT